MKNKILTTLLGAISLVLIAFCGWSYFENLKLKKELDGLSQISKVVEKSAIIEAEIISRDVDRNGANHAITKELNKITKADISRGVTDSARLIDSFASLANARLKEINSLKQVAFSVSKKLELAVADSLISYKDKYLQLTINKPSDSSKTTQGSYLYNAELNELSYFKKKNFLSKKQLYTNYWLSDPSATINGVKNLEVVTPLPKELNIIAVTDVIPTLNYYSAGIGAELRSNKINASAAYNYDLNSKKWLASGRLSFALVGF